MKKFYLLAAVAAIFAACSSDKIAEEKQVAPPQTVEPGSVVFDSYVQRSTTRSGLTGTMTYNETPWRQLLDTHFGVFGYYTDNKEYEGLTIPDFFYNQKVTHNTAGYWEYIPVKYWPNEYGSSAIADDNDKVSFFAYAPYVEVTPSSGKPSDQTYGIAQLSRNSATGDPYVKYIASFDWQKAVDLLWGVIPASTNWPIVSGETQTLQAGMPWLNVERPKNASVLSEPTAQKVKFQFQHALSKLNVQIDYDADDVNHNEPSTNNLADATRVYVRSVSFTGFAMKGALNLNNVLPNVPLWKAYDAENDLAAGEAIVVNDGRKDGKEGVGGAVAPNEPNIFLNPALIQTGAWSGDNKGVLNKFQNLFAYPASEKVAEDMKSASSGKININSLTGFDEAVGVAKSDDWDYTNDANAAALLSWPIMVIPNGDEITITIVYDVETVDNNLATKLSDGTTLGSSIENRITKTITFSNSDKNYMEAGKKYTIKLHLGLNSVKFDADVTGWDDGAEGEAWLPDNIVSYQAPGVYNYNVLATDTKTAEFKLTGFAPNEDISTDVAGTPISGSLVNGPANGIGEKTIAANTFTIAPNTTVLNVITDNALKFTGITSGKQIVLNLVQAAAQPDGTKSEVTVTPGSDIITFALKDADGTVLSGDKWTEDTRNVQIISATRNGVPMTELSESDTPTTATQFKCSADGEIKLGTATVAGEKFIFTIKVGDAGEFTVKKESASFSLTAPASVTTTAVITGVSPVTAYTATATKDGNNFAGITAGTDKFVLTADAADYNKHTYVVTVTKTATGESHSVTITQDAVELSGLTADYTPYTLTLSGPTVTPSIAWSWSKSVCTIKVFNSGGSDVTDSWNNNENGTLTKTGLIPAGTYTVIVSRGDCSISANFAI